MIPISSGGRPRSFRYTVRMGLTHANVKKAAKYATWSWWGRGV